MKETLAGVCRKRGAGALRFFVIGVVSSAPFFAKAFDWPQRNVATWDDVDAVVASGYSALTNEAMVFPPGNLRFGFSEGYFTFTPGGEVSGVTNSLVATTNYGVTVWHLSMLETQTVPRAWIYRGADGATVRTVERPYDDPQQWILDTYRHGPPAYLTGSEIDDWYADRDRSRFCLALTLVNADDWPALLAGLESAATNVVVSESPPPVMPADTNSLSFVGLQKSATSTNTMDAWVFTPSTRAVAIITCSNLLDQTWTAAGSFESTPPFNLWQAPSSADAGFFMAGYADVDSDFDGLSDFLEIYVTKTDPHVWDSAGTLLGDFDRMFVYGLSPTLRDSNGDGLDDDEAILAGFNPMAWNPGASAGSIRYYYDADDRLVGAFSGSPGGAVSYRNTPAGNALSAAERSAP